MVERQEDNGDERDDESGPDELGAPAPLGDPGPTATGGGGTRGGAWRPRGPRSGWWLLAVPVVLVALALAPTVISGLKKTPRDRVGISYGGGPVEGVHFQRIVQPGSNLFFNGFFDSLYLYPSDQVNYIVSQQQGQGAEPTSDAVVAPTSDRVQVTYQVAVYFKLNTDRLRDFHEQLGLRYKAYTTDGWNALIRDTFRQQIENALQEETRKVAVADLVGDADLLVQLQDSVQTKLTQRLEDALGEQFFCAPTFRPDDDCGDPTFVIKKVDVPASVTQAFEDVRTSDIQVQTKENEVRQREAEARAIDALGLTGQEYDILKAIESGKITFWVLNGESGITITGPDTGTGSAQAPTTPGSTTTTSTTTTTTTTAPGGG